MQTCNVRGLNSDFLFRFFCDDQECLLIVQFFVSLEGILFQPFLNPPCLCLSLRTPSSSISAQILLTESKPIFIPLLSLKNKLNPCLKQASPIQPKISIAHAREVVPPTGPLITPSRAETINLQPQPHHNMSGASIASLSIRLTSYSSLPFFPSKSNKV